MWGVYVGPIPPFIPFHGFCRNQEAVPPAVTSGVLKSPAVSSEWRLRGSLGHRGSGSNLDSADCDFRSET